MAKINLLLEQSYEALLCGPSCQKEKTKKELEQKYLQAQTNLQSAPYALETAKKNYYLFAEGEGAYNSKLESELKLKAEKVANIISEKFVEEFETAKTLNIYLNSDLINSKNTLELYEDYMNENKENELVIKNAKSDLITNDRKTFYETQEIDNLKGWYNILYICYYIIALVFFGIIILKNENLTNIRKISIVILLIIYPYIIDFIVQFFIGIYNKLKSYLPKNVYKKTN